MKQLTVISGKGGTGKTTLVAAFASLAHNIVLADCDVDAADLHLILKPDVISEDEFIGLKVAVRNAEKCISCGKCLEHCRFGAVGSDYSIKPRKCEGCGVCEYVCPVDAIEMVDRVSGEVYESSTRIGPMSHAALKTAEEATGKLISVVRSHAKDMAEKDGKTLIIIDGPPGTGCPVISSITGVDMVLVVTEPTLSGIHDMERILDVSEHFGIPAVVCINKYDINEDNTQSIKTLCGKRCVEVVGQLPYDDSATQAMIKEKSVVEFSDGVLAEGIRLMWAEIEKRLANI